MQTTISTMVDEELVKKIKSEAAKRGKSMSRHIAEILSAYYEHEHCQYCGKPITVAEFFPWCSFKCLHLHASADGMRKFMDAYRKRIKNELGF